jgi:hypothetical protein
MSKISLLPNLKQGAVNDWMRFLKRSQYVGEKSQREMTLQQLAATIAKGAQDNGRR